MRYSRISVYKNLRRISFTSFILLLLDIIFLISVSFQFRLRITNFFGIIPFAGKFMSSRKSNEKGTGEGGYSSLSLLGSKVL